MFLQRTASRILARPAAAACAALPVLTPTRCCIVPPARPIALPLWSTLPAATSAPPLLSLRRQLLHCSALRFAMRNPTGGMVDSSGKTAQQAMAAAMEKDIADAMAAAAAAKAEQGDIDNSQSSPPFSATPSATGYHPASVQDRFMDRCLWHVLRLYPTRVGATVVLLRQRNAAAYRRVRFWACLAVLLCAALVAYVATAAYLIVKMEQVDTLKRVAQDHVADSSGGQQGALRASALSKQKIEETRAKRRREQAGAESLDGTSLQSNSE